MTCVDKNAAAEFCSWLGGELPSSDQWRYAATNRATTSWPRGNTAPTCDLAVLQDAANTVPEACQFVEPQTVCSRPEGATELGLCDLVGNVSEWVRNSLPGAADASPPVVAAVGYNFTADTAMFTPPLSEGTYQELEALRTTGFRCVR